jgi:hypothetical protein
LSRPGSQRLRSRTTGLGDHETRLADLSRDVVVLHRLDRMTDRDLFIPPTGTASVSPAVSSDGRPVGHPKILFKLLVVLRFYGLPDGHTAVGPLRLFPKTVS